jgi:hypothetical protein
MFFRSLPCCVAAVFSQLGAYRPFRLRGFLPRVCFGVEFRVGDNITVAGVSTRFRYYGLGFHSFIPECCPGGSSSEWFPEFTLLLLFRCVQPGQTLLFSLAVWLVSVPRWSRLAIQGLSLRVLVRVKPLSRKKKKKTSHKAWRACDS